MVSAGAPAVAGKKRFDRSPWTLNPAAPRYVPASVRRATLSQYGIFQALASNQGGESIRRVGIALQPFTRIEGHPSFTSQFPCHPPLDPPGPTDKDHAAYTHTVSGRGFVTAIRQKPEKEKGWARLCLMPLCG
jgi:hypothetical protein